MNTHLRRQTDQEEINKPVDVWMEREEKTEKKGGNANKKSTEDIGMV